MPVIRVAGVQGKNANSGWVKFVLTPPPPRPPQQGEPGEAFEEEEQESQQAEFLQPFAEDGLLIGFFMGRCEITEPAGKRSIHFAFHHGLRDPGFFAREALADPAGRMMAPMKR